MKKLRLFIFYLKAIKFYDIIRWYFYFWNKKINIEISGFNLKLRRNSPDLRVAIDTILYEYKMIKELEIPNQYVIVDCGGYIGTSSLAFTKIFSNTKIYSFEPSKENYKILNKNISNSTDIVAYNKAVTYSKQKLTLHNRNTGQWGFTTIETKDSKSIEEIDSVSIKEIIEDYKIFILKLDIEGAEHDILKNCHQELAGIPVIIIELHDRIVKNTSTEFFNFCKRYKRIIFSIGSEKFITISKEIFKN